MKTQSLPSLEKVMEKGRAFFLCGIGGVGMSGIAQILKSRGISISGSDLKSSKVTRRLEDCGIEIKWRHEAQNIIGCDAVIYTSAVARSSPELQAAESMGIPVFHRSEVLSYLMNRGISIAVTGTHGKSTCSAFLSYLVHRAGLAPTCAVGADMVNFGSNVLIGNSHLFVAEVDESDRSHLKYQPDFALVTNLESDHLDVYKDLEDIKKTFCDFVDAMRQTGCLIYSQDDPVLSDIVGRKSMETKSVSFGMDSKADFSARDVVVEDWNTTFSLVERGSFIERVKLGVPGRHNIMNALGVIALLRSFGMRYQQFLKFMPEFQGVRRRLEVKLKREDVIVIDDYAHHPSEVRASLQALKSLGRPITAVFQPHRYSRTALLGPQFMHAFEAADHVIITDIYGAGETNVGQVLPDVITQAVKTGGHPDVRTMTKDLVVDFLTSKLGSKCVIAFLGAGDIGELADEFASLCQNAYSI